MITNRIINRRLYAMSRVMLLSACLLAAVQTACKRDIPPPAGEVTINLAGLTGSDQVERFVEVRKVVLMPPAVKKWFTAGLADPGQKFRDTDRSDSKLPQRRLLVAGVSPQYCIVHYERGGFAHGYVVVLFSITNEKVDPLWTASSLKMSVLADVKSALESGKVAKESLPSSIW